jgi:hypothetical protein
MGPIGNISASGTGAIPAPVSRARALQKLNAASNLHSGLGDQAPPRQDFRASDHAPRLACSGTMEPVSFRYAERLVSPFVAQLLGQLLPDPEIKASQARAAYGAGDSRISLLLDARL